MYSLKTSVNAPSYLRKIISTDEYLRLSEREKAYYLRIRNPISTANELHTTTHESIRKDSL